MPLKVITNSLALIFSAFAEHIFNLSSKLSITPGLRYEFISTSANGNYREKQEDLAGNIIYDTIYQVNKRQERGFIIGGIGINYKLSNQVEIYTNFSQNYRSINFCRYANYQSQLQN